MEHIHSYAERSNEAMKDVLMNPQATGPSVHYHMIRGGTPKTNITVWEPGTVGGEYIKSYGHYHVGALDETYKILQGEGYVLLQKRKLDSQGVSIDDEIETFRAVKVKAGDQVYIPKNTGHLTVNTGKVWLVTSDNSPVDFGEKNAVSFPGHADYAPFKKMRGAAYYVVEKNSKPEFVKNPLYKVVPAVNL